jgi:hypothetical protein
LNGYSGYSDPIDNAADGWTNKTKFTYYLAPATSANVAVNVDDYGATDYLAFGLPGPNVSGGTYTYGSVQINAGWLNTRHYNCATPGAASCDYPADSDSERRCVATHELGHIIGLAHTGDSPGYQSIMNPLHGKRCHTWAIVSPSSTTSTTSRHFTNGPGTGSAASASDPHADLLTSGRAIDMTFSRRQLTVGATLAVAATLIVGSSLVRGGGAAGSDDGAPKLAVRIADAELASGASSLSELGAKADVAVIATAGGSRQEAEKADPSIVTTYQSFTVDQNLWGNTTKGNVVEVAFTGGKVDPVSGDPYMLELEGQPQFEVGSQYVLTLLGPTPSGDYLVLGGSQGRYLVSNGQLQAVAGTAVEGSVQSQLNGLSVDQAVTTLQATRR